MRNDAPISSVNVRRRLRRRAAVVAVAWVALLVILGVRTLQPWPDMAFATDFASFWTGATLMVEGAGPNLFDLETQRLAQVEVRRGLAMTEALRSFSGHLPYISPPPLALVFVPLLAMPYDVAYVVWFVVQALTFLLAVALPLRRHPWGFPLVAMMLPFGVVAVSLFEGQVNGLFALALSLALLALAAGRPLVGGALLGLLWLKPQYALLFALVFVVKRRWREALGMAGAGLGLAGLSVAMVGLDGVARYLAVLGKIGAFYPPSASMISPEAMINWRSLLMHAWPGIPGDVGSSAVLGLGVATALASLLVWRGEWDPTSPRFARQMLAVTLATVVVSPHSHFHGAALVLSPLALTLARSVHEGHPVGRFWSPLALVSVFSTLLWWPLGSLRWAMGPCLILTLAALIVASLMATANPGTESPR